MIEWLFESLRRRRLRRERARYERTRPHTSMERMLATAALLRAAEGRKRR